MMRIAHTLLVPACMVAVSIPAGAEIVDATPTHYVLKQEAISTLTPAELWTRLIEPSSWWHPEHTFSGSAANLSLEPEAGGLWREDWDGGSVRHGAVVYIEEGKTLRLDAPFGPLQQVGAKTTWTITIEPSGDGSKVTFDEVAFGPPTSKLDELAPAVDFVKNEAINRLATPECRVTTC